MNEQNQVNEGYTIIESMTVGNARFVIGENLNNPAAPYVTWQANIKTPRIISSGDTTVRPNWVQLRTSAGVSRKKPNFSVNGQNPKRRRYQNEVMNDEQTRCKPPDLR